MVSALFAIQLPLVVVVAGLLWTMIIRPDMSVVFSVATATEVLASSKMMQLYFLMLYLTS